MTDRRRNNKTSIWLSIGVAVLIILLLVWLTVADFFGDTDVAAMVSPALSMISDIAPVPLG